MPHLEQRLAARQPDRRRPQVMHHRWECLLFLHWTIAPVEVQRTLPAGLIVDTYQGQAYLGIIPFFMRDVRLRGLPSVPRLSAFQELNVRTYVYDEDGVPGIWFYSLSCNQPLAVAGARLLAGLPYRHANMTARSNELIEYSCRRSGTGKVASYRYRGVGSAQEAEPASLEFFLLERYYLYAVRFGSLLRAQVSHQPYRYSDAQVETWSTIPAELDGFRGSTNNPDHLCYVDRLDVKVYATQKIA